MLIDLLRESLAGIHRVWRADDATHAADLMVASGNAVLLIDASLADHNTKDLVTQIHKQFPDLAIIVAGRRDDEHELAPLVSEGVIFRFLHKPASAERIRNFVDATQRRAERHGPRGDDAAAPQEPALRRHGRDCRSSRRSSSGSTTRCSAPLGPPEPPAHPARCSSPGASSNGSRGTDASDRFVEAGRRAGRADEHRPKTRACSRCSTPPDSRSRRAR